MRSGARQIFFAALVCCAAPLGAQSVEEGAALFHIGLHAQALQILEPLAEQGDAVAQHYLGTMYRTGQGVVQDYTEAVRWYQSAAEEGYVDAQLRLGAMYYRGDEIMRDYREAARWYRLAAEQGSAAGQHRLGRMYLHGHGVLQDDILAFMWFSISASSGNDWVAQDLASLSDELSSGQIADAQARARACMSSRYEDCD